MTLILKKFLYFFCFLLLACCFTSCKKKTFAQTALPIHVTAVVVERKDVPAIFEYIGVVQSSHEVEIRARVTGYLEEIAYIEGSYINKGNLLFQLDPRPFQATLAQAKAQVAREQAVLWEAQRAVARFKPLYEQKAASQRDLDNAMAQEMSAIAQVMSAQAQVADAEINLSYTTMRSPISGLIGEANYRVGSLISPTQNLLTTIFVIDPIWVNFSISEQDVLKAQEERNKGRLLFPPDDNFEIELILANQSVFPEKGKVNFASPTYSQKTGTMMVRAVLHNPEKLLRPGQFVRVKILGALWPDAMVVPQRSVVQSKNGTFVFVINADNQAEMRPIDPGPWSQNDWIIFGGLKAGDKVIVDGVNKVLSGSTVIIDSDSPKTDQAGINMS